VDALVNFALGILLIAFPRDLVRALGIPDADCGFYPGILGGVLVGIGVALWLEARRRDAETRGLGLAGAVVINLCGGAVLAGWLLFGGLDLPVRGRVLLWALVAVLIGLSTAELVAARRGGGGT
jgi:hypothetical protein